jgi:hypothetical protein
MHQPSQAMERFFRTFEANASTHNPDGQASQFADVFLAAGPQGTQPVRAADFALALPKRKQLFDRMGCRSTQLVSLTEKRLDTRYVLAQTVWKMTFQRPDLAPQDLLVESSYIIDTGGEGASGEDAKIVFYLAHQDIMQIVRDRGLLPS